jgi:hypothetical protein
LRRTGKFKQIKKIGAHSDVSVQDATLCDSALSALPRAAAHPGLLALALAKRRRCKGRIRGECEG